MKTKTKLTGKKISPSWLIYPAIILLGFVLYANTFEVPFLFDDRVLVAENPKVKIESLTQIGKITAIFKESRPLTLFTFALNYYSHRLRLSGYHLVNIVLHIACGILVYLFLCRLFAKSRYREEGAFIAAFAALLFIAHPIQTQAVTYIVQRGTSLSTLFYLSSLLFFILGREKKSWSCYVFSVIFGLLAWASKQIAVTLPVIVLLYDFYFYRNRDFSEVRKVRLFYLVLLAVPLVLAITYTQLDLLQWLRVQYQNRTFTLYQRVLTEFRVVVHYLTLLIFPLPGRLNIDHHIPLSTSLWSPPATFFAGVFWLVFLGTALSTARKRPVISFFLIWFLINILLESSVLGLELIFEHRMYLPSVAFFPLVGILIMDSSPRGESIRIIGVLGVILILFYGWGTIVRNRVWRTELALWQDAAGKSPEKHRVLYNLGHALAVEGRYKEALREYLVAVRIQPNHSETHNNLGSIYGTLGRHKEAINCYIRGLRLDPENSRLYNNLGNGYRNLGQYEEAIASYRKALSLDPDFYRARNNLGGAYYDQEKYSAAIEIYRQVIARQPEYSKTYYNLALVYKKQKDYVKAIEVLGRGISAGGSGDADLFVMRGDLYMANNSPQDALADLLKARSLKPDSWEIRSALGGLYKNSGNFSKAVVELEAVVRLKPDLFNPRFDLAFVYKALTQYTKALNIYLSLLKEKPELAYLYYNIGNIYVSKKNFREATRWFEKALQRGPESREFAHNLAMAHLKNEDIDGAEKELLALIGKAPDYLMARENLALLYMKRKEPEKAVSVLEALLEKFPRRVSALNQLGMIFYKNLGQKDRGIEYFRRSLAQKPDQPEAHSIRSLISAGEKEK